MKTKVLLDTNVLIAASVYFAANEDYSIPIKHMFFDRTMQLIGLIKKHLAKRIGIVTVTIENEANTVLNKAILDTVVEYAKSVGRTDAFRIVSDISDSCESRLSSLLIFLLREPIDPFEKSVWFIQVTKMFDELKAKANEVDPQDIAYRRAGGQSYKSTAYKIYLEEETRRYAQLKRLLDHEKEPDQVDKEILAEAAYLRNFYAQTEGKISMFLATSDYTLSPIPGRVKSTLVTDEIQKRFSVTCDWCDEVARKVSQQLNPGSYHHKNLDSRIPISYQNQDVND